jgi:hypothetical protein
MHKNFTSLVWQRNRAMQAVITANGINFMRSAESRGLLAQLNECVPPGADPSVQHKLTNSSEYHKMVGHLINCSFISDEHAY